MSTERDSKQLRVTPSDSEGIAGTERARLQGSRNRAYLAGEINDQGAVATRVDDWHTPMLQDAARCTCHASSSCICTGDDPMLPGQGSWAVYVVRVGVVAVHLRRRPREYLGRHHPQKCHDACDEEA